MDAQDARVVSTATAPAENASSPAGPGRPSMESSAPDGAVAESAAANAATVTNSAAVAGMPGACPTTKTVIADSGVNAICSRMSSMPPPYSSSTQLVGALTPVAASV